jgi:hypothetical protein
MEQIFLQTRMRPSGEGMGPEDQPGA